MAVDANLSADDCFFYFNSTCSKGDKCSFRHCLAALGSHKVCQFWSSGICMREGCPFRHSLPTTVSSPPALARLQPCYWEKQPSGCLKQDCPYKHRLPRHTTCSNAHNNTTATTHAPLIQPGKTNNAQSPSIFASSLEGKVGAAAGALHPAGVPGPGQRQAAWAQDQRDFQLDKPSSVYSGPSQASTANRTLVTLASDPAPRPPGPPALNSLPSAPRPAIGMASQPSRPAIGMASQPSRPPFASGITATLAAPSIPPRPAAPSSLGPSPPGPASKPLPLMSLAAPCSSPRPIPVVSLPPSSLPRAPLPPSLPRAPLPSSTSDSPRLFPGNNNATHTSIFSPNYQRPPHPSPSPSPSPTTAITTTNINPFEAPLLVSEAVKHSRQQPLTNPSPLLPSPPPPPRNNTAALLPLGALMPAPPPHTRHTAAPVVLSDPMQPVLLGGRPLTLTSAPPTSVGMGHLHDDDDDDNDDRRHGNGHHHHHHGNHHRGNQGEGEGEGREVLIGRKRESRGEKSLAKRTRNKVRLKAKDQPSPLEEGVSGEGVPVREKGASSASGEGGGGGGLDFHIKTLDEIRAEKRRREEGRGGPNRPPDVTIATTSSSVAAVKPRRTKIVLRVRTQGTGQPPLSADPQEAGATDMPAKESSEPAAGPSPLLTKALTELECGLREACLRSKLWKATACMKEETLEQPAAGESIGSAGEEGRRGGGLEGQVCGEAGQAGEKGLGEEAGARAPAREGTFPVANKKRRIIRISQKRTPVVTPAEADKLDKPVPTQPQANSKPASPLASMLLAPQPVKKPNPKQASSPQHSKLVKPDPKPVSTALPLKLVKPDAKLGKQVSPLPAEQRDKEPPSSMMMDEDSLLLLEVDELSGPEGIPAALQTSPPKENSSSSPPSAGFPQGRKQSLAEAVMAEMGSHDATLDDEALHAHMEDLLGDAGSLATPLDDGEGEGEDSLLLDSRNDDDLMMALEEFI